MFDNQTPQPNISNNQGATPPVNRPPAGEPEDIFAGTDNQPARTNGLNKPPQFQPKVPVSAPAAEGGAALAGTPAPAPVSERIGTDKKYIIIGIIVIAVLTVILFGMVVLAYYKSRAADNTALPAGNNVSAGNTVKSGAGSETAAGQPAETKPEESLQEQTITPGQTTDEEQIKGQAILNEITDSDGDGLMDGEEERQGTNPNNSDSDSDGLFDREEVRVYKTDPLNPDTDADGYRDGDEVKNGYNPNGAGKIYELPK